MIIPKPKSLVDHEGVFKLESSLKIVCNMELQEIQFCSKELSNRLRALAGIEARVMSPMEFHQETVGSGVMKLELVAEETGHPEGYSLCIRPQTLSIRSSAPAGLQYGIETLCKLIMANEGDGTPNIIPCLDIQDAPVFEWRGMLLDCSRHFLSVAYIKHCIDMLARLKMNRLHWHLADNEGWRLELKKYPELTTDGSFMEEPGFYTQEEVKEIVRYALERSIMVIPEIEVPGHSFAVFKTMPWLCCTGMPKRNKGHQKDLYCAGKEEVFHFLQNVLDEVMELFPAPYIHLGGDEAPKERWIQCRACQERIRKNGLNDTVELQGYMLRRIAGYISERGRKAISWDESLECGIGQDMLIQWWRYRPSGEEPVLRAVRQGHKVIASPNSFAYLSFPTDPDGNFGAPRTSDLRKVYQSKYIPDGLSEELKKNIIGAECCIWTEHLTERQIDRMVFPRMLACAELMWAYPEERDFAEFMVRVRQEQCRLKQEGVEFGPYFSKYPQ